MIDAGQCRKCISLARGIGFSIEEIGYEFGSIRDEGR